MSCDISTLTEVLQSGDPEQAQATLEACIALIFDPTMWLWAIAFSVVGGVGGWLIGKYKRAGVRGTLLGPAFGPIRWAAALILPAQQPHATRGTSRTAIHT